MTRRGNRPVCRTPTQPQVRCNRQRTRSKLSGTRSTPNIWRSPRSFNFRSDWIEPVNLEGTRYGTSDTQGTEAGRDVLRRQGDFDSLQARSDSLLSSAIEQRRGAAEVNAAADPMQPAADAIEAFLQAREDRLMGRPSKVQSAQSASTTATKDEAGL